MLPTGTRQVLVRVGGRLLATKSRDPPPVRDRRLAPEPRRDHAGDRGRRARAAARRRSSGPSTACRAKRRPTRGRFPRSARLRGRRARPGDARPGAALPGRLRLLRPGPPDRRRRRLERPRPIPRRLDAEARDRRRADAQPAGNPRSRLEACRAPLAHARLLGRPLRERAARGDRRLDLRRLGPRELDDARAQPRRQRDVRRLPRRELARTPADPARDPRPPVLHRQVHDRVGPGPPRAGPAPRRGRSRRPRLALPGRVHPVGRPLPPLPARPLANARRADAGVGRRRDGAPQSRLDHEGEARQRARLLVRRRLRRHRADLERRRRRLGLGPARDTSGARGDRPTAAC